MTKTEVEVGAVYRVRWHDGSFTNVRIVGTLRHPTYSRSYGARNYRHGTKTRYQAINLATGRLVTIKSAAKLRERVS